MRDFFRKGFNRFFMLPGAERNGYLVMGILIILLMLFKLVLPLFENEEVPDYAWVNAPVSGPQESVPVAEVTEDLSRPAKPPSVDPAPFEFDPNTLDAGGFIRLGIHEKVALRIIKYRNNGGKFKVPEDLKRIYGFRQKDYERLSPYIRVEVQPVSSSGKASFSSRNPARDNVWRVEINTSDTAGFKKLRGIGSKLALRIVNYRNKLGGFHRVDQVAEVYGIDSILFASILPNLSSDNQIIKKLNINKATVTELKAHPYISYNVANAIVQYRDRHGNYSNTEALKNIAILNASLYDKILPYLTVD